MSNEVQLNLSDLINKPRWALEGLGADEVNAVRLRRRDAEDLLLMKASRHDQELRAMMAVSRLMASLLDLDDPVLHKVLPDAFPWARTLPYDDQALFLRELTMAFHVSADLENLEPVARLVTEWRNTAAVLADADLVWASSQPVSDLGPVSTPDSAQ